MSMATSGSSTPNKMAARLESLVLSSESRDASVSTERIRLHNHVYDPIIIATVFCWFVQSHLLEEIHNCVVTTAAVIIM